MIKDHEIEQRISMNIPGRVDVSYDMVSGKFILMDDRQISFKCIMSVVDGICEIDVETAEEVSPEEAIGIQKFVAESLYNKENFEQGVKQEKFFSHLRTPQNEYSGYDIE